MAVHPLSVLFLCTGNSARSIMAEALLNHLPIGKGRFRGYSAGSHPTGRVHPMALETLGANGLPVDGYRSKSWDEFSGPDAPRLDFVFTVCDHAAAEVCPIWPGRPTTAHWGTPDPAAVQGTPEERRKAFDDALITLRRRIELFASLPLEALGGLALQTRLDEIGKEKSSGAPMS
jgi:arsenate reductase